MMVSTEKTKLIVPIPERRGLEQKELAIMANMERYNYQSQHQTGTTLTISTYNTLTTSCIRYAKNKEKIKRISINIDECKDYENMIETNGKSNCPTVAKQLHSHLELESSNCL